MQNEMTAADQKPLFISEQAFALRPMRIFGKDRLVLFEAITFPKDPFAGCELYLRRAALCGPLSEEWTGTFGIDVLDYNGSIVQTIGVTQDSFEYLRGKLNFRRAPEEPCKTR